MPNILDCSLDELEARESLLGLPSGLLEAMPEPAALLSRDGAVIAANGRWTALEGAALPEPPGGREAERPLGRITPTAEAVAELLSWRHEELALSLDGPPVPRDERRRLRLRRVEGEHDVLILAVIESSGARLWRELGVRTEHLDAVTEAMAAFLPAGDFAEAGAILLRSAMIRTASPCGFIATCRDQQLAIAVAEGLPSERAAPTPAPCGFGRRTPAAWIAGMASPGIDGAFLEALGFVRALVVPILRADEPLGVLVVGNGAEAGEAASAADIEVIVRVAGVLLDAARRREHAAELERQLRGAQRIESIGRLAGGVAHDFNNMLTVVLGLAAMIRGTLDDAHPHARLVDEITSTGQRAASLTRQLLAFSRRQVLQPELMNLSTTVSSLEPLLHRLIKEDVSLELRLQKGLSCVVADVSQVEQVLMNLVVNARDAMPSGGTLTIETADVVLDEEFARRHVGARPGPHVLLSVSDTGVGMDASVRARVFEPFFTTKPPTTGTGLGLSTAYGIVRQSGGTILAQSEPGKGATFSIYLPRAEGRPAAKPAASAPEAVRGGGERILVVEDEPALRSLVVTALRSRGYAVSDAPDGEQALLVHDRDGGVDLVVTDLVMPGMGGAELAARLRILQPEARILYMSGYSEAIGEPLDLLDDGAVLLEKPFTIPALLREVRRVLERAPRT